MDNKHQTYDEVVARIARGDKTPIDIEVENEFHELCWAAVSRTHDILTKMLNLYSWPADMHPDVRHDLNAILVDLTAVLIKDPVLSIMDRPGNTPLEGPK